ncbi:MAG: BTAD domain-containing putative transcriptional regulator [Gaiellaceae bacterium]
MEYRILGPFEALDGERQLPLGGAKQRAVLALLLLHANEPLTRDVIVDELWGENPPPTAAKVLQNCVSALRKELPADTIRTVGGAYCVAVEPGELDRDRFERLLGEGRVALEAGDHADASDRLRQALALWHGTPLSDFSYERFAQDEISRLEELHVSALEDRIEAELALGHHDELVAELEGLVNRHPLRENLRAQLMVALYRGGRQAEALEVYRDARRVLLSELGIEPGRRLRELERAILAQDPGLDASRERPEARPGRAAAEPLEGRDGELALLEAGLEDALAGRGRLFVVVGDAGAGKSRLADALASSAKQRGTQIFWGRAWAGGGAPAYWPWTQALKDALPPPGPDEPEARFSFFAAATEMLRAKASAQPLLLVLDDLQAADENSMLLLEFVATELPEMAALVLALGRHETARLDELERCATRVLRL